MNTTRTLSLPSVNAVQKLMMFSAVISEDSGLYLVISSSRVMRRRAGHSSFLRPKNSKMRWLSSTSLSMKMKRICRREDDQMKQKYTVDTKNLWNMKEISSVFNHLALKALRCFLKVVQLLLEVFAGFGHKQQNVGLDVSSKDLGCRLIDGEGKRKVIKHDPINPECNQGK